jgi:hypothetical protein
MTISTIKRKDIATYINTVPAGPAAYELLGEGITTGTINYNPQTTEEVYIHQASGTTQVESYKPTMPIEAEVKKGDPAFDFIETLRVARAVLSDAETDIVNVWLYETPTAGAYPAEQQNVSIQIDSFGGEGGKTAKINYTINFIGDPVAGTFDPTTKTFTAS